MHLVNSYLTFDFFLFYDNLIAIGLMHDNVICSKFTTKPRLRELFSTLCHLHAVFTWVFFSFMLLREFVHDKICKFALRKRGLVVKLTSLT